MKAQITIDIEKKGRSARFFSNSCICLRFTYCTHDDFHAWLDKNSARIQKICIEWQWAYDVGYSDKVVSFSKI